MERAVLLVATATSYIGTARIPSALSKAGFEVSLLAPRNTLAEKSRFVTKVGHLPDNATPLQWVFAFADMVKASSPRLVLPCDDTALRLLQTLALSPPQNMQPALHLQLATLIRESLGSADYYRISIDKTLLPGAAEAVGVRVPPYAILSDLHAAEAFVADHGYPVVLKRGHGAAGDWVAIAADRAELEQAFAQFSSATTLDIEGSGARRLLIQAHIPGRIRHQGVAAWKGDVVAGFAREKLVSHPPPKGPATVTRYFRAPEVREFSEALVKQFGMNGLFSFEYVAHERTGQAYLLEINRRITPGTHTGALVGVDICAAPYAVLNGMPPPSRKNLDEGEEHVIAHFPQEWLRDPGSHYLRDCRVDAPWDDPDLFEAMLASRHG